MSSKSRKLSNEELASFCSQVSILLQAGITPTEGIRILLSDTNDSGSKKLLQAIIDAVNEGNSFAESLDLVGVFPDYVINTIKLGEKAGSLDEVMAALAAYYEREVAISESIRSAITYPLVMIVMMLVVIVILITRVLPIFNQVFIQLGTEMTGFAASLMRLGDTLKSYSVVFIAILAVLLVLYFYFSKTSSGKKLLKKIASKIPLFKGFYDGLAAERFASGMALAISAGLDTFESLKMVSNLVENKKTEEKIEVCRQVLLNGDSLADGLKEAAIFSNVNNRMVAVGIKTGDIEQVLTKIADGYERANEKKINNIISVIEPTLVIVLSLVVGLILLSVILPLMGIMTAIG